MCNQADNYTYHQGEARVTCAKIIGYENDRLRYAMSAAVWCCAPATHATVCDVTRPVSPLNVGHFYCDQHAPADSVLIPTCQTCKTEYITQEEEAGS